MNGHIVGQRFLLLILSGCGSDGRCLFHEIVYFFRASPRFFFPPLLWLNLVRYKTNKRILRNGHTKLAVAKFLKRTEGVFNCKALDFSLGVAPFATRGIRRPLYIRNRLAS